MNKRRLSQCQALILAIAIASSSFSAHGQSQSAVQVQNQGLMSAFGNIRQQIGEDATSALPSDGSAEVDAALDDAFNPDPKALRQSAVTLDQVASDNQIERINAIASTPINGPFDIDFRTEGTTISLLLWKGAEVELKTLTVNILKQLYSFSDPQKLRIIVTSDPIPYMTAEPVDMNDEVRARESRFIFGPINMDTMKQRYPELPGVEIRMSAGMFATFKSVDEYAAYLARALASKNPKVYGVETDPRFKRSQAYISLIEQAIQDGASKAERDAQEKLKDGVAADISAMEKLNAGGFNPMALFNHEERKMSWLADVFLKSPKHSLGRWLVRSGKGGLFDWTRPIRLQVQTSFMAHLRNIERGRNPNLDDTEFSLGMKWIRLRMKLFTEPFFAGMPKQLGTVAGAVGTGVLFTLYPNLLHNALMAIQHTSFQTNGALTTSHGSETHVIGEFVQKVSDISRQVLDSSYFGVSPREVGATVMDALKTLRTHYVGVLEIAGAATTTEFLRRYGAEITNVVRAAGEEIGRGKVESITADESKDQGEASANASGDENNELSSEADQMLTALKKKPEVSLRQRIIGQKIGRFLVGTKNVAAAVYGGSVAVGSATGRGVVAGTIGTGRLLAMIVRGTCYGVVGGCTVIARGAMNTGPRLKRAMQRYSENNRYARERNYNKIQAVKADLERDESDETSFLSVTFGALKIGGMSVLAGGVLVGGFVIMAPVKLGVGTFKLGAATVGSIVGAVQERANRKRTERADEDRRLDIVEKNRKGIEDLLTSQETTPGQIQDFLQRGYGTDYYDGALGLIGIDYRKSNRRNQYDELFMRAVRRWIELVKLNPQPRSAQSLEAVYAIMDRVYKHHEQALLELSAQFIDLVYEIGTPQDIDAFENRERFRDLRKDTFTYMNLHRRQLKNGKDRAEVVLTAGQHSNFREEILDNTIRGHESELIDWMAGKDSKLEEVNQVLAILKGPQSGPKVSLSRWFSMQSFNYSKSLQPIQRAKLSLVLEGLKPYITTGLASDLKKSISDQVDLWLLSAKNIEDLAGKVETDCRAYKIDSETFATELMIKLRRRMDLIHSLDDVNTLFAKDFFWSNSRRDTQSSPLEEPLRELLKQRRQEYANNPAWKYDPVEAEKSHSAVRARLLELKLYPTKFTELESFWELCTNRGLSTVTDGMLDDLIRGATPERIQFLEHEAVQKGRVFDQAHRDEFALRQIKASPEFAALMAAKDAIGTNRMPLIFNFISATRSRLKDFGLKFSDLMEQVSQTIHSTKEEAKILQDAKVQKFADDIQRKGEGSDSRVRMFQGILPYIKKWSAKNQYEFLLYLRGQDKATEFIDSQFPEFGPERIRRMYRDLPLEARMGIVGMYLQETFLARKKVNEGYGKNLIEHLLSNGSGDDVQEYSGLLLESLLHGIAEAKIPQFQKRVLSALVAMDSSKKRSIGETIKLILEQFPGVGPKVGQFLVATRRLPKDINEVLALTQDGTNPPPRYDIYEDIGMIAGNRPDLGITLLDLLGGGSLKYSVSAIESKSRQELALQVFREDAQNSLDFQIEVLDAAITYLIKKNKQWAFLRVIVDGALNAVQKERNYRRESSKTKLARLKLYQGFSDHEFTVAVPEQELINQRLLVSKYARGISFRKLSNEDKTKAGLKILDMESQILFSTDRAVTWYDADRHPGNFLIDVAQSSAGKHYSISPIDFGQLTYIRNDQREKVFELNALSSMMTLMGANDSIAEKVAGLFGIQGSALNKLKSFLSELFPLPKKEDPNLSAEDSQGRFVVGYFSLIAAINESVRDSSTTLADRDLKSGKLDMAYTDFMRAIIQLYQYEEEIHVPDSARTPRKLLTARTLEKVEKLLPEVQLSAKQKLAIGAENMRRRLRSQLDGTPYQPVQVRLTREQLSAKFGCAAILKPLGHPN